MNAELKPDSILFSTSGAKHNATLFVPNQRLSTRLRFNSAYLSVLCGSKIFNF